MYVPFCILLVGACGHGASFALVTRGPRPSGERAGPITAHVNVRRNYRWSVGAVTGVGEGQEGVRRRAELSVPFNMLNMEGVWRACRGLLR